MSHSLRNGQAAARQPVTWSGATRRWTGSVYVIDGRVAVDGEPLRAGDAAKITGPADLRLGRGVAAELILIDVPLDFEPTGVWAGER